jgi:hypothetical protein
MPANKKTIAGMVRSYTASPLRITAQPNPLRMM